jgi:quercetin dioxygenase-like cupin family protein
MRSHDFLNPRSAPVETAGGSMFSGLVWGELQLAHHEGAGVNRVTFAPRSRTFWHSHEGGQMLLGQAGSGLVVTRAGEVAAISEGVIVHGGAGEQHWHGGGPASFMTHLSVVLSGQVEWFEAVTDEEYDAAVRRLG